VGAPAFARRCAIRTKYASHRASRAALHLDLLSSLSESKVFQHPGNRTWIPRSQRRVALSWSGKAHNDHALRV